MPPTDLSRAEQERQFRREWEAANPTLAGMVAQADEQPRPRAQHRRTRSEVLAAREKAVAGGCCNRFAEYMACECLENALPDPLPCQNGSAPARPLAVPRRPRKGARVLEAARSLSQPWSLTALVLQAWSQWPEDFGLPDCEKQHPDPTPVRAALYGVRGLCARGFIKRLPDGLFRVAE